MDIPRIQPARKLQGAQTTNFLGNLEPIENSYHVICVRRCDPKLFHDSIMLGEFVFSFDVSERADRELRAGVFLSHIWKLKDVNIREILPSHIYPGNQRVGLWSSQKSAFT